MSASKVGETTITTPSDRELTMTRSFDAPRELVWEAWTSTEHVPNWLLGPEGWTMPVCEIDLREGGKWHYAWRHEDGNELEMRGVFQEIAPPERLVHTESWGENWDETTNTVAFTEEEGRTTVTITSVYPSEDARDAALATGMADGANRSFDLLAEYLPTIANRE